MTKAEPLPKVASRHECTNAEKPPGLLGRVYINLPSRFLSQNSSAERPLRIIRPLAVSIYYGSSCMCTRIAGAYFRSRRCPRFCCCCRSPDSDNQPHLFVCRELAARSLLRDTVEFRVLNSNGVASLPPNIFSGLDRLQTLWVPSSKSVCQTVQSVVFSGAVSCRRSAVGRT